MTYAGDDFNQSQLEMSDGVDGLNNVADLADRFVLDARNVDLSSPGYVQKRPGYHLYGCKLPIRVARTAIGAYDAPSGTYQDIDLQFDFVGEYTRTIDMWLADGTGNADYGDARYYYGDKSTELVFCRINGYTSNPNTNTITTDTVIRIDPGGVREMDVRPIAVFDNNTFLIGLQRIRQAGISPNVGAGIAISYAAYFGKGPTFNTWEQDEIANIEPISASDEITVEFVDIVASDVRVNDICKFDSGVTDSSATNRQGFVQSVDTVTNKAVIKTTAAFTYANPVTDLCRIYHTRCNSGYYRSQTIEFLIFDVISGASTRAIGECNKINFQLNGLSIKGTSPGTFTDIGFFYGTDIDVPPVNMLAYFYDTSVDKNRLVTGYDGNVFVETDPTDRIFNTLSTPVIANQTVVTSDIGQCQITVPDSSLYEVGDTVTLQWSTDGGKTLTEYTFTIYAINVATALEVENSAYDTITINIPTDAKLSFTRSSTRVYYRRESYDDYPVAFPGSTFQIEVGNQYAVHRVVNSFYDQGTANWLETANNVTWSSDSTIKLGTIFAVVDYPESSTLENYEPMTQSYFPETLIDLSSALIDRTVYIAAQKDGLWKYNGSELINMYLPAPPTPLLANIPGSSGNLRIDEDSEGRKVGRFYNMICTYSYFEFTNGILTEIEGGITAFDSGAIQAEPALDGSFNSALVEVQVKSIPRDIGLPADSLLVNLYRTTDGTADGLADGAVFYKESSVTNNPDNVYTMVYGGNLTSSLLRNGKPLYASISSESTDEFGRNVRTPPLANHIINFQDRLIAFNGREKPFFNFVANDVFASDGTFNGEGALRFVPANPNDAEYRFSLIPAADTTTSGSLTTPDGETINYQVFTSPSYDVESVTYAGNVARLTFAYPAVRTSVVPVLADRLVVRTTSRDTYKTDYDGFNIDSQVFVISGVPVAGTSYTLEAEKPWTDELNAATLLSNGFWGFTAVESSNNGNNLQCIFTTDGLIELLNTSAGASYYDAKYIVIKGIGTLPQMQDKNDSDNRVYDIDTDVVFLCTVQSTTSNYTLTPYKIETFDSSTGHVVLKEIKPDIGVQVVNIATTVIEGVAHDAVEIFEEIGAAGQQLDYATLTSPSMPNNVAIINLAAATADLGLSQGDYVSVSEVPANGAVSKIPSDVGIDFNKVFEVNSYVYGGGGAVSPVIVFIDRPTNVVTNFANFTVAGKLASSALISFSSTYVEITTSSVATTVQIDQDQWVYVVAKTPDTLQHSLQLTGWFKVYQVNVSGTGWTTQAVVTDTVVGYRLYMDGDAIDQSTLIGLTNVKILVGRNNSNLSVDYVPVPMPVNQTDDLTGRVFGPLDGLTPLEKISKRLGNAITVVLSDQGFAYWGSDPGALAEEYPINGFKFINHKWPYNKYDENLIEYPGNKYSLEFDLPADNFEWLVNGGQVTSDGTLLTGDFLEQRYPSRCWYTTPGDAVFRDLSFGDISSEDAEEIIGAVPFEEFFLVWKESQMFKVKITPEGLLVDRIQARVGAVSKKNIVPADSGAMFMSKNGFFYTDGNSVKKIVRLNRIFRDYVKSNTTVWPFTCGVYDPVNYFLRLGAPVADTIDGSYADNDRHLQLSFNRTSDPAGGVSGGGWSIGTNIPANVWMHVDGATYFGAHSAGVYKMREEVTSSRWRDDESAISMQIDTRFYDFGYPDTEKQTREIVLQLDTKFDNSVSIYTAWEFRKTYHLIGSFSLDQSALATTDDSYQERYAVSAKFLETRRQTIDPQRNIQIGFRFTNSSIDENGGIHGVWAHVKQLGPKAIRQR